MAMSVKDAPTQSKVEVLIVVIGSFIEAEIHVFAFSALIDMLQQDQLAQITAFNCTSFMCYFATSDAVPYPSSKRAVVVVRRLSGSDNSVIASRVSKRELSLSLLDFFLR